MANNDKIKDDSDFTCPHCGSHMDLWFDRSYDFTEDGECISSPG